MHHPSVSWEITLLYFFSWNFITWFGKKESIVVQDFKLSTVHAKFHQICTLKSTEELCLMTLKSDARFEEKLICCFKLTRIWWILTQALESLKNVLFDWLLCAKKITFDLKKSEELSFLTLKRDAKFEEKLTCGLQNDMRNLPNFHQSTQKSQNWDFDEILLLKVENVWA